MSKNVLRMEGWDIVHSVQSVPILSLRLDARNPRFILPDIGESQENIRKYLLEQEDALALARNIVEYGGLMPGERIVVSLENEQYVVLEGNRRTCVCQMLVNRELIPHGFEDRIPALSDEQISEIANVSVDVIPSRDEARRFLATRHIERAREWSTIAKMRFCYEDYNNGHSVPQIRERTGLTNANINKYIRNYKILMRGLEGSWSSADKEKLFILDIEPDKLIRIFTLADTKSILQLYFDDQYSVCSNIISKEDLDDIIHVWTQKAFIDDEMDTRTLFGKYDPINGSTGACKFIEHILEKYFPLEEGSSEGDNSEVDVASYNNENTGNSQTPCNGNTLGKGSSMPSNGAATGGGSSGSGTGNSGGTASGNNPTVSSRFFSGLNYSNIQETAHNGKGVILVCKEIERISTSSTYISNYPICTAFIIRSLIEQSIKYYTKKNGYWAPIMQKYRSRGNTDGEPQLSFIINEINANIGQWLPDQTIRRLFYVVFKQHVQVDKMNLVIHSPELYTLAPNTLREIPGEGLLAITNYFLA